MSVETLTDSPPRSKRAFSYLRVSSPSQAKTDYLKDGLSIEVQRGGAEDKSEQLNASIEHEFVDPGKSAFTDLHKRTDFLAMLDELKRRNENEATFIHYVIIWNLSRWARNVEDHFRTREMVRQTGAQLVSIVEPMIGEDTPESFYMEGMMAVNNEYESRKTSRNVKSSLLHRGASSQYLALRSRTATVSKLQGHTGARTGARRLLALASQKCGLQVKVSKTVVRLIGVPRVRISPPPPVLHRSKYRSWKTPRDGPFGSPGAFSVCFRPFLGLYGLDPGQGFLGGLVGQKHGVGLGQLDAGDLDCGSSSLIVPAGFEHPTAPQDVMVVLGDDEWRASAVAEHERVEGGEQQTGRVSSVGNRSTSLGGPAASSARRACVVGSEDHFARSVASQGP
jgi:DNA invertase Pin-like site-specific DNA recombinase